jgi:hypothetical protein
LELLGLNYFLLLTKSGLIEVFLGVDDRLVQGRLGQYGSLLSFLKFNQRSIVAVAVGGDGIGALTLDLGLGIGRLSDVVRLYCFSSSGGSGGCDRSREILTGPEKDIKSDRCDLGEEGVHREDIL